MGDSPMKDQCPGRA